MSNELNNSSLRIPLIVGIIGHIDIADSEERIKDAMNVFWNHLSEIVPDTRFILLSSLAKGADHLAVKYRPREVDYCAVLPFEQAEFEKAFSGEGELDDFRSDLRDACKTIVCDAEAGNYTVASDYIRTHSDFILSLWDGRESLNASGQAKAGGTYQQIRSAFNLDDILVKRPEKPHAVVNIRVSRKSIHGKEERNLLQDDVSLSPEILLGWNPKNRVFTTRPFLEWFPVQPESRSSNTAMQSIDTVIYEINKHNRLFRSTDDYKPQSDYFYDDLTNAAGINSLPAEIQDDYVRFDYFDRIAGVHQKKHYQEFRNIAILSFVAGLLGLAWGGLTFSTNVIVHERILHCVILLYLIGCFCAWLYYKKIKKAENYFKYIYPRVIAELMRLKLFWTFACIPFDFFDSILKESANYWFALPVCNWEIEDKPQKTDGWESANRRLDLVRTVWMHSQVLYYERRSREYEKREAWFNALKRFFFWGAFSLAAFLLLIFISVEDQGEFLKLSYYREFIIGVCPFVVSSIGWLLEKNNWGAQAREYRKMAGLFRETIEIMKAEPIGTDKQKQNLIQRKQEYVKTLMKICHDENSVWQEIKRKSGGPEPMF